MTYAVVKKSTYVTTLVGDWGTEQKKWFIFYIVLEFEVLVGENSYFANSAYCTISVREIIFVLTQHKLKTVNIDTLLQN
jgi:hypothetical protein